MNAMLRSPSRLGMGALIGLLSAGVALGVGELVAALVRPAAAPVIAVGNRFVLATPESVKRWAIRNFGTNDKHALLTGIYIGVAIFALVVGVLAAQRLAYGLAGVLLFGAIGTWAAVSDRGGRASDVIPTLVGTAAALAAMWYLHRCAGLAPTTADEDGTTRSRAKPTSTPPSSARTPTRNPSARTPAAKTAKSAPTPPSTPPAPVPRRGFLTGSVALAGLAAGAGFGGRAAQHARFDVSAARAAVRLPAPSDTGAALPPAPISARAGCRGRRRTTSSIGSTPPWSCPR